MLCFALLSLIFETVLSVLTMKFSAFMESQRELKRRQQWFGKNIHSLDYKT